ncbi:MAG TPA: Rpn family recombination-promoting nuclease/putative transposase [Syntrophomonadaceae bacterium]|nr:Rpn family recombination-promoting nuclease/putative transposase [Syntrophomonadaceae bacterium]
MGIITQPHDKFFKETLSDLETTKDFLQNYLPSEILSLINLDTLKTEKDTFIDEDLTENFSDLLFKANINNQESFIYFLFEHKSYISNQTPLQLLKYMIKIWETKINKEKSDKLPLIIPIVIYHGAKRWQIDEKFIKMIEGIEELPGEIIKHIPQYEYILYDLSPYGDEEIKGNTKLKIFLDILKAIFGQDQEEILEVIKKAIIASEKLERQTKGIEYFETYIRYIMNVRDDLTFEDIYQAVKDISLEGSEDIMTIAEKLIKEGMEKGRAEEKRKTVKNLLRLDFPLDKIAKATELSLDEIEKIKREIEK